MTYYEIIFKYLEVTHAEIFRYINNIDKNHKNNIHYEDYINNKKKFK